MLRFMYQSLLRLHPERFRERFADEMLSIFDQTQGLAPRAKLVADAGLSLFRQWTIRSEYWHERTPEAVQATAGGGPVFFNLEEARPRMVTLIEGAILTWIVCFAILFTLKHSHMHYAYQPSAIDYPPASAERPSAVNLSSPYVGVYATSASGGPKIKITDDAGQLTMEIPGEPKYTLVPVGPAKFRFSSGASQANSVEFVKQGDGHSYQLYIHRAGCEYTALPKLD
jgi:hypothetical protein